jgi:hypothetical protein
MIDGHRQDLRAGILWVGETKPMRSNSEMPADILSQMAERMGRKGLRLLGQSKERHPIPIGENPNRPARIDLSRVGLAGTKKCSGTNHVVPKQVVSDLPSISQLGRSNGRVGPFGPFRTDRHVGGLTTKGKLHAVLSKDCLCARGSLIHPSRDHCYNA